MPTQAPARPAVFPRFHEDGKLLLPTTGHTVAWTIYFIARQHCGMGHVAAVRKVKQMSARTSPAGIVMLDSGFRCAMLIAFATGQTDEGLW